MKIIIKFKSKKKKASLTLHKASYVLKNAYFYKFVVFTSIICTKYFYILYFYCFCKWRKMLALRKFAFFTHYTMGEAVEKPRNYIPRCMYKGSESEFFLRQLGKTTKFSQEIATTYKYEYIHILWPRLVYVVHNRTQWYMHFRPEYLPFFWLILTIFFYFIFMYRFANYLSYDDYHKKDFE